MHKCYAPSTNYFRCQFWSHCLLQVAAICYTLAKFYLCISSAELLRFLLNLKWPSFSSEVKNYGGTAVCLLRLCVKFCANIFNID